MRVLRRIGLFSSLTITGLALIAGVPSATAAVNLGQTGDPTATCSPDAYSAQTEVGGAPGYTVPPGYGVITSWSFQGSSTPGTGQLLVWRPTGTTNQFILQHLSATESFSAGVVQTFPIRLPVEPNDVLGMHATQACLLALGLPGDLVQYISSATQPAEGSAHTFFQAVIDERLLVSARVEPDADRDGFGDETQDQCPTNGATQGPCVTGQRAAAIKKCKKKAKQKHWTKKRLKKCKRKAKLLPV